MRFALWRLTLLSLLLTLPSAATPVAGAASGRTNFVIVLADDLGYGDLGCYGHPLIRTPHLDTFAKAGIRFTDCHAGAPLCSPSRAALLTGRTPFRSGVYSWIPAGSPMHLRSSEITIARLLKDAGYATCHVGKWHCNGKFNSPEQPQPGDQGFDHWMSTQNNAGPSHENPVNFVRNGKRVGKTEGYSATLIVDEALRWLDARQGGEKDKPFLLCVWFHNTHEPVATAEEFVNLYPGQGEAAHYYGNVTQMDHEFGRLMKALEERKLRDDTVVLFTSDNGPETLKRYPAGTRSYGSPGPLRGMKLSLYEGGIRVPGLIRWPGRVKAGGTSDVPINGTDVLPTVCEIAAVKAPDDRPIDGVSLVPLLSGKPLPPRKHPLYWRFDGGGRDDPGPMNMALRDGDWKLLADKGLTQFELYNLREDVGEKKDLSAREPDRLKQMGDALRKLNAEVEAEGPKWPDAPATAPARPGRRVE
jgi:arylsulfatase A